MSTSTVQSSKALTSALAASAIVATPSADVPLGFMLESCLASGVL